ncbi:hypothetical protein [Paenibacillus turpanensis]|uniref:hypothetical protein n=1 Tax=Paenibacillus turpanensis TaxID=2689078 RepID=UPI001409B17C|nr:hypothetical protein [Paenibacillus turpanensis]
MSDEFIAYIGDYKFHDAVIENIENEENNLTVILKSIEEKIFSIQFLNVINVNANRPIGMMLYSLSEMREEDTKYRKFVFTNWEDEDDAFLEVIAKEYIYETNNE